MSIECALSELFSSEKIISPVIIIIVNLMTHVIIIIEAYSHPTGITCSLDQGVIVFALLHALVIAKTLKKFPEQNILTT